MRYDLETICHRTPFLGANLPIDMKLAITLSYFKTKIKRWKHNSRVC